MPYKNPENKRQWEQEHREQRNAQRRQRRLQMQRQPVIPQRAPDPLIMEASASGWKVLLGFAVAVGIVVLAVLAGVTVPDAVTARHTKS